ncbi:PE-PPE domain-containing protein [Rhodococcus spelaei]|uniref:PE-PPE domain-containing protein n=1 Tax=Rhodococcus spelaei TaxID=2546320 RepID=A0A541BM57_9NOCA|nr:PE-PPE domain-containing protein [Rhodococcus spelaei]TQF73403.1 PE-PPE domain-containing protein [Rhodococcus spelaei]
MAAKHTLFVVPGTWEAVAAADGNSGGVTPSAEIGMLRGVTDLLNRTVFDVVYVNYPASFGPIPGGGERVLAALGDPSYRKSRDMGIAEVIRLINAHQGTFGLLGYSQGGAVVSLVGRELVSGALRDRQRDCLWLHAVASPHRGLGRTFPLGNRLAGQGISGDDITATGIVDWFDFCLPGDIYGDADLAHTYLQLGYELATELTLSDPVAMVAGIAESLVHGQLRQAILDLGEDPLTMLSKTATTAAVLAQFLHDDPHVRYGTRDIIPGSTALAYSAGYLNFWGPRR